MSSIETFAKRLRELRTGAHASRTEMAEKIGIPLSSLGNYERGEKTPGIDVLYKLCEFYDVTADFLLGLSDSPKAVTPWPPSLPIEASDGIQRMKLVIEKMISSTQHSTYGLSLLYSYTEILEALLEIDSLASQKLHELQLLNPEFRNFGAEAEIRFDNTPIVIALASGNEDAVKFAQRLTAALQEIEKGVVRIAGQIEHILLTDVLDSIRGNQRYTPMANPILNATDEQRELFRQGRADAENSKQSGAKMDKE